MNRLNGHRRPTRPHKTPTLGIPPGCNRRVHAPRCARSQLGTSLIEVLVAMVVLAIGLLGVAALQLKGLQSTHAAYQRTIATLIARDAAERLWVDLADGAAVNVASVHGAWLAHWQGADVTLPGLEGGITRSGQTYRIRVTWSDHRLDASPTTSFEYVTSLLPDK